MLAGATGLKPGITVVTGLSCRPVLTNLIHLVVKPADRIFDRVHSFGVARASSSIWSTNGPFCPGAGFQRRLFHRCLIIGCMISHDEIAELCATEAPIVPLAPFCSSGVVQERNSSKQTR